MIPQRPRTRRASRRRLGAPHLVALVALLLFGAFAYLGATRLAGASSVKPPLPSLAPVPATPAQVGVSDAAAPGGLSAGTCIEYRAAKPGRKTVFVDPGHGGLDPGAVGTDSNGQPVAEKTLTLAVGLDLAHRLLGDGYNVVLARTQDVNVARMTAADQLAGSMTASAVRRDTLARVACANAAHADALVSIHFDAFDDPAVGGIETLYDDARTFTAASAALAADVHAGVLARFQAGGWQVPDRGVWKDSDADSNALTNEGTAYGHLLELGPAQPGWVDHPSLMPGALTEPLFVTRPSEADLGESRQGQDAIAAGIEDGLRKFFSATP
jgi:N-acetylmuramoyl-L-alanine amidase